MVPGIRDDLQLGRESYDRRTWSDAYRSLSLADQATPLNVGDLERLATSAYLMGRDLDFQRCLERLHRAHVEAGDKLRAARCAFWLACTLMFRGEMGQSNAWTARAQRLVEGADCVEHGYCLLLVAEQQIGERHLEVAHALAADAVAIGDRFGDIDLTAIARHVQGRVLVQQGRVMPGLRLLDETMLAVIGGELSPIVTGLMYCSVIEVCREVYALSRAREWTFALSRWCEQQSEMVAFTGVCLVHRAEIMQFHGAWSEAMAEARRACERAERAHRKPPAAALYQQAEIHRLRGEFAEAEQAYRSVSQMGREPQPGLALLRMAQGQAEIACAAIRRLVSATADRSQRARLLPAYLELMLATGDLREARNACSELQTLVEVFDTDVFRAMAAYANGAVELAQGHARAALVPLRCAFEMWERLEAPYEAARVRVLLGLTCRAIGDEETGALDFDAARAAFERLGAQPDVARLNAIERSDQLHDDHPLTAREREVLRLIASGHTNKAIAEELSVSERTIDRHVSNILGKLDVPSRTAATAYAYDHKLF